MTKSYAAIPFTIALVFSAPLIAPVAGAQDAGAENELVIEEIIVTARKREESLLDAPLTVTAFSADDIQKMALDELPDLVDFSPGFHYSEHSVGRGGRFNRRLIFRGMNPRTDRQTRQGATVFIDGAPILGSEIGSTENYERIEVIKGPQSAYFGRSTFSGAINAVTKTPGDEWAGRVSAEAARFGTSDFGVQIEGPLVEDRLSFRLTGSQYETGGEYENSANPTQRLGEESTRDIALSLFATPTDNFSAKFRFHLWKNQDGPSVGAALNIADNPELFDCTLSGRGAGGGAWLCGEVPYLGRQSVGMDTNLTPELQALFFSPAIVDAFLFDVPVGFGLERNAHEISLVLDYEFANGLALSSITAVHENQYVSFEDFDRRPTAGLMGDYLGRGPTSADSYSMSLLANKDFSQEIRLSSAADQRLRWIAGVSYTEIEARTQGFSALWGRNPNPNPNVATYDPETKAAFAGASYDINDQFTLNVEARKQHDKVIEGSVGRTPLEFTFKSFTPRVILDWKPREGTTLYATYAKGTNPGQFNAGLLALTEGELKQIAAAGGGGIFVEEEQITNIEFGVKSLLWNDRIQVSAAVYFSDWDNVVAPEIINFINADGESDGVQVNATGGQADLSGLELEGTVLLSENLTLDGTFGYNKSEINDFESPDALNLFGSRTIDDLDNAFSRYPETSGTLSLTYQDQLPSGHDWFVRGDLLYRGSTWMTNANVTKTPSFTTFNLRAGLEMETWRVELYGTNIFNEEGYGNLQLFPDLSGLSGPGARMIMAGLLPRPSFGVRTSFEF